MLKKVKVIMLPSKKAVTKGQIYTNPYVKDLMIAIVSEDAPSNPVVLIPQHLYITSDDKIEEGDWQVDSDNKTVREYDSLLSSWKGDRRIIAATDSSLKLISSLTMNEGRFNNIYPIEKQLPQPSQLFIKKYVEMYNKGQQITDVMVEFEDCGTEDKGNVSNVSHDDVIDGLFWMGHRLKVNSKDNTITIKSVKDSWSREEVETLITQFGMEDSYSLPLNRGERRGYIIKWLKENL